MKQKGRTVSGMVVAALLLFPPSLVADNSIDPLLAEACLLAACEPAERGGRVKELLQAALRKTSGRSRSRVYTLLGDFQDSGAMVEIVQGMQTEFERECERRIARRLTESGLPLEKDPDEPAVEKVAEQIGKDRAAVFKGAAEVLSSALSKSRRQALKFYVAATVADEDNEYAWYRLAVQGEIGDRLRREAIEALIRCDRKNALPYYLMAAERIDRDDVDEANALVRLGNSRDYLRFPTPPIPQATGLNYPSGGLFKRLGFVGKSVPQETINALCGATFTFSGLALPGLLRHTGRKLVAEGRRHEDAGKLKKAAEFYRSVLDYGLQLANARPHSFLNIMHGRCICSMLEVDVKRILPARGPDPTLARAVQVQKAFSSACSQIRERVLAKDEWNDDAEMRAVLSGEDSIARDRREATQILRKTGLDQLRTGKHQR